MLTLIADSGSTKTDWALTGIDPSPRRVSPVTAQSVFVLPLSAISVSIIVVFLFKIKCKSSQICLNLQDYWEKYARKGEFFVLLQEL